MMAGIRAFDRAELLKRVAAGLRALDYGGMTDTDLHYFAAVIDAAPQRRWRNGLTVVQGGAS